MKVILRRYEDAVGSDLYRRNLPVSGMNRLACQDLVQPSARLARDVRDQSWPPGVRDRVASIVTATTTVAATAAECMAAPPQADVAEIFERWQHQSLAAIVLGDEIQFAGPWKGSSPTTTTTLGDAAASHARSCSYLTRSEARSVLGGPVHQVASDFACLYRVGKVTLIVEAVAPSNPGSAATAKLRAGTGSRLRSVFRVVRTGPVASYWQTYDGHGSLSAYARQAVVTIWSSATRAGRRRAIAAMRVVVPKLDGPSKG